MKVTVFLDGRAGHEKQSLAIIRELQELANVEVKQVVLKKTGIFGRIFELFNILLAGSHESVCCTKGTDLYLGTGSRTHLALIGYGKKYNKPIVTCMAPERFLRPWFDLCCVPRHDGLQESKNVLCTDGPPVLSGPEFQRDPAQGLILVGGIDERSHVWSGEDIARKIAKIAHDRQDIHWSVSSSPRTPPMTVELLQKLAEDIDNLSFYPFHNTPRGWVEEQYAKSNYAWVTADSVSMIYEAVTAGCRVGVLPVEWNSPENKFLRSIDFLAERRLVVKFREESGGLLENCNAGNFNEARRCANEIIRRFGPGAGR